MQSIFQRFFVGKILVSFIAVFTAVSPYLADWNETHIYNPRWTPHAKFHNAQTMAFGTMCEILALAFLWRKGGDRQLLLVVATIFAALYWITQSLASLFPGVAFLDPEFAATNTMIVLGVKTNQVMLDFVIFFILAIAYYLEYSRIKAAQSSDQ